MLSLTNIIRKLISYIPNQMTGYNAHWGVLFAIAHWVHNWKVLGPLLAVLAVKEYWYDARYESTTQTFWDNTKDFLFYSLGAVLGFYT